MNVQFSREMGALTLTETWLSIPWAVKSKLIDAIDEANTLSDLSADQQTIIRQAKRERARARKFIFIEKAWNEGAQQRDDRGRFAGTIGAGNSGGGKSGAGTVEHDPEVRAKVTEMILQERTKGDLDPSSWEQDKPWLASREAVEAGQVRGFRVSPQDHASTDTVLAANTTNSVGKVTLYPNFFNQDTKTRELVLFHEAGHDVARVMAADGSLNPLINRQMVTQGTYPSWSGYRFTRREEVMSDAYAEISPALGGASWPKRTTNPYDVNNMVMFHEVGVVARGLNLPISQSFREADREWFGTEKGLRFVSKWSEGTQIRDDHGRFAGTTGGSGGGGSAGGGSLAPLSAEEEEGVAEIKQFLGMTTAYPLPPNHKYSQDSLILEKGQAFAMSEDTFKGKRGTAHHCFENSAKHVMQNPDLKLTYVEGYLNVSGVSLHHAWAVDQRGRVIDPTINPGPIRGYFGVPFKTEYVQSTALRTGYWGIISHQTNREMFRQGPPSNAYAKVGE